MNNQQSQQRTSPEELSSSTSTAQEKTGSKKILKLAFCLFALIGLLAVALIAYVAMDTKNASLSIDETTAVEQVMEHTYGKYSSSKRGWIYVAENGNTYVVTVVQQKKIEEVGKGDELYFVTSGTKIASGNDSHNDDSLALYGVFKVTSSNNELHPLAQPYNFAGTIPLTPERVRFEVFNQDHWGWVLKHSSEHDGIQSMRNEILIAGDSEIHKAAQFISAYDNTKAVQAEFGNCEKANAAYATWNRRNVGNIPEAGSGLDTNSPGTHDEGARQGANPESEPQRCTRYSISYRTDPVTEKFFTALHLTYAGVKDGMPVEQRKWKIMFDQKSYTYLLPKELEAD